MSVCIEKSDRATIIGANGTGKSTLANYLIQTFTDAYPRRRVLVADTKPRWRATRLPDGRSARSLYKRMAPGDTLGGSVTLGSMRDWSLAWDKDNNPSQVVILQNLDASLAANVQFQTVAMERFFRSMDVAVPSLLYIDEGHDFFSSTGSARGSDIIQRCYRAGRERGLATLAGFQRPKGINQQCLTELNKLALFRINNAEDVKRLHEMGWPKDKPAPTWEDGHHFRWWENSKPTAPMFNLNPTKTAKRKAA